MCSLDDFLNYEVPNVLRKASMEIPMIVIGTRAINIYLQKENESVIQTQDWDVAIERTKMVNPMTLAINVANALASRGYESVARSMNPSIREANYYSFRSRPWARVISFICGTQVVVLDVYQVPSFEGLNEFVEHDGLIYSDLGFLLRELLRSEHDFKMSLLEEAKISHEDIMKIIHSTRNELASLDVVLKTIYSNMKNLNKNVHKNTNKRSHKSLSNNIKQQRQSIRLIADKFLRILKERELLIQAVSSGRLSKDLVEPICGVCREYEQHYQLYYDLKNQCEQLNKICQ